MATNNTTTKVVIDRCCQAGGETMGVGRVYEGTDARYLVTLRKAHPYDKSREDIVKDGAGELVAVARVAGSGMPESFGTPSPIPDATWTREELRRWLLKSDPSLKIPTNASKDNLIDACLEMLEMDAE